MTAPRVDLYGIIHKTLRVELFETGARLARTNFADPDERGALIAAFNETMGFIEEHGGHEPVGAAFLLLLIVIAAAAWFPADKVVFGHPI